MHIDPYVALAGLIVGFTVGLTGMGGGALMTPILVLLFKIQPLAAVSSDLVAALVMKPVGGGVHARRGTVNWALVRWLCMGSVPGALGGVLILNSLGDSQSTQDTVKTALGAALLLASLAIVLKAYVQGRNTRKMKLLEANGGSASKREFSIKPVPTLMVGILGGIVVGMTSVGSGSMIIVLLMLIYPTLSGRNLVGTDLVQAIPLVGAAALGHIFVLNDFHLSLTASILIGSLPGVYVGARLSSIAPDGVVRPALVFVLLASALKLLNVPTGTLGWILLGMILVGLPVWGAIDSAIHHEADWLRAGFEKGRWIALQAVGAPFLVGFGAAVMYFATVRPKLAPSANGRNGHSDRSGKSGTSPIQVPEVIRENAGI
jgi:uncharacterized membrane protein YfcA